jgi:glycosyltransferase involved in cell wall biosynthesis
VGAAPELIESYQNGVLVNAKDHQEMLAAIEWLLGHRDLWEMMGANARKGVAEKCSIGAVADKYLEMFSELQKA